MVVLASRPSVGKSLFACNIAENIAIKPNGTPVLVISCEMSASSLYRRALFGRAGVDGDEALRGTTTPEEKDALRRAHGEIRRAEISVLADGNMTAQRVHAAARRFKAHHESCVVIVDYLQLLNSDARGAYERATELSKAMKSIAVDLDVPMLVLSQLSRNAAESRDRDGNLVVKRPTLADLRDSGAIEQDADVVLFLSRDITQREPHPCDVDIAKNRPGVTGHTQVQFQPRGPRFVPTTKVEQFTGR
jgi:replicative DNA helicase